jgi:hypothetical protein
VNHVQYQAKCDPQPIMAWLYRYTGHEHLGVDIKEVSLEKYLAVAPDVYVLGAMLQSVLLRAQEQKEFAELGDDEKLPFKPYSQLTEAEKNDEAEQAKRKIYLAGMRKGHDQALIELANRITYAARDLLDQYRLENPEYDPALVVDETALPEID